MSNKYVIVKTERKCAVVAANSEQEAAALCMLGLVPENRWAEVSEAKYENADGKPLTLNDIIGKG